MTSGCGTSVNTVAVLCAAPRSVYHSMTDVEVYDLRRDARTFAGGMPVVAHPPCRAWSAFTKHQAKPEPGEQALGLFCAHMVLRWGGVLEQPAFSGLFAAAGLPLAGDSAGDVQTQEVWQSWWGHTGTRKRTWLCFVGCEPLAIPYRLRAKGRDKRLWQTMPRSLRSATCPAFAEWLVSTARLVQP